MCEGERMTKDNPDELCPHCREFDRGINGGPISHDFLVVCDHDVPSKPKESMPKMHRDCECEKCTPKAKDYCACCEHPEVVSILNKEILLLREEIWNANWEFLISEFSQKDVKRALQYFLAMPTMSRNGRSSYEILRECCQVAKTHREENERR